MTDHRPVWQMAQERSRREHSRRMLALVVAALFGAAMGIIVSELLQAIARAVAG